jgi:hypothetical protein
MSSPGYSGVLKKEHRPQIKRDVNITSIKYYRCQEIEHSARDCSEKATELGMKRGTVEQGALTDQPISMTDPTLEKPPTATRTQNCSNASSVTNLKRW